MGDIGSRQVRFEVLPVAGTPAESVDVVSADAASVDVVHTDLRARPDRRERLAVGSMTAAPGPARA